jgi:hypothetical protein
MTRTKTKTGTTKIKTGKIKTGKTKTGKTKITPVILSGAKARPEQSRSHLTPLCATIHSARNSYHNPPWVLPFSHYFL